MLNHSCLSDQTSCKTVEISDIEDKFAIKINLCSSLSTENELEVAKYCELEADSGWKNSRHGVLKLGKNS